jgi:hypothetical protein
MFFSRDRSASEHGGTRRNGQKYTENIEKIFRQTAPVKFKVRRMCTHVPQLPGITLSNKHNQ